MDFGSKIKNFQLMVSISLKCFKTACFMLLKCLIRVSDSLNVFLVCNLAFLLFYLIVVVCMQELDKQIVDYTSTYVPDDQLEWSLVLEEIKSFIKADGIVSVLHADSNTIVLSHRYTTLPL